MLFSHVLFLGLLLSINSYVFVDSARILAIFPTPSFSHQIVLRQFTIALHKRGHELVVITPDPIRDQSLENYTEINTDYHYAEINTLDFIKIRQDVANFMGVFRNLWWTTSITMMRDIYEDPEFKKLYALESDTKFDLIIVELMTYQGLYGLSSRFNAPIIGITSLGLSGITHHMIGNPLLTSHQSVWELGMNIGANLPFWQRLRNFYTVWYNLYIFYKDFLPLHDEISKEYLGPDTLNVAGIAENISLVFVNQNHPISFVRPNVPKVIPFGSIHVAENLKPLPEDLQKFLDGATDGFIYVSLGSNAKSKFLPKKTKEMFLEVFSNLAQRVLWKYEDDLPETPNNVFISKWLPQQSVLNHPNIKLFVYQGGLQSTEEAVSYKVPLLGIPVLADQDSQVNKMVSIGVAKSLEILKINKEEFESSIKEMVNDKGYKERMIQLNALIQETPYDPMEHAMWWTEFVIRHKGAPHLQSTTVDDPWYRRNDVDLIAFLAIAIFMTVIIALVIFYKLLFIGYRLYQRSLISRKKKSL